MLIVNEEDLEMGEILAGAAEWYDPGAGLTPGGIIGPLQTEVAGRAVDDIADVAQQGATGGPLVAPSLPGGAVAPVVAPVVELHPEEPEPKDEGMGNAPVYIAGAVVVVTGLAATAVLGAGLLWAATR